MHPKNDRVGLRRLAALALAASTMAGEAVAAPITFDTALPVSQGEIVWRGLFVAGEAGLPGMDGAHARTVAGLTVLGYGVDGRLALFGMLPVAHRRLELGDGTVRETGGLGDVTVFTRWTTYSRDRPGRTLRIAPFVGVKLPTGATGRRDGMGLLPRPLQPGTGTTDALLGVVATAMAVEGGVDIEARYDLRGRDNGFDLGDHWQVNASVQRLITRVGAGGGAFDGYLYGLVEGGYEESRPDRARAEGAALAPERHQASIRPGLQYAARRWIGEMAMAVPFARSRVAGSPRERWRLFAGLRMNF